MSTVVHTALFLVQCFWKMFSRICQDASDLEGSSAKFAFVEKLWNLFIYKHKEKIIQFFLSDCTDEQLLWSWH